MIEESALEQKITYIISVSVTALVLLGFLVTLIRGWLDDRKINKRF